MKRFLILSIAYLLALGPLCAQTINGVPVIATGFGTATATVVNCPSDGVTDATSCFTTAFANDNIFIPAPATAYYVNGAIQMHSNQTIVCQASKTNATQAISQHSTTSDTFFASFATSGARNITINGCQFYDAVRSTRTTGAAIHVDGGTGGGSGVADLLVENTYSNGFQDGLWTSGTFNSNVLYNRWSIPLRDGYHELGGAAGATSTLIQGNYSDSPGNDGVYMNGCNYCTVINNAVDGAIGPGAYVTDDSGGTTNRGVSFIGNGSEQAVQNAMLLDGQSIRVQGGALTTSSSGTGYSAIQWNRCINCSVGSDVYISGDWDYCIDMANPTSHDIAFWTLSNTIGYPLPKCGGATLGFIHDASGITGGGVVVSTPHNAVTIATTGVLSNTPTYANTGTLPGGFGATLTAGSNGIVTVDGHACVLNDRVLVKNQASAFQNGIYVVSTAGTVSVPYVLTRSLDYTIIQEMNGGPPVNVINGTSNASTSWQLASVVTTIGTDALTYAQVASGGGTTLNETYVVGTGGVTANTFVKMDGSNPEKVIACTTSDTGCFGVALTTVAATGNVVVQQYGTVQVLTDNAVTAGDLGVMPSGTNGYIKDSGQTTVSNLSTSTRVLGTFLASASGGALVNVELRPAHFGSALLAGSGIVTSGSTISADTSIMASLLAVVSGSAISCVSSSGNATTYTCTLPSWSSYTNNQLIDWIPDVSCTGSTATTLQIGSSAALRIVEADGATNPTSTDCPAGRHLLLSMDSTLFSGAGAFRIVGGGASAGTANAVTGNSALTIAGGIPFQSGTTGDLTDVAGLLWDGSLFRIPGGASVSGDLYLAAGTSGISNNQTPATVSGSTSGTAVFTQPMIGGAHKEVIIYLNALLGTASWTFLQSFSHTPGCLATSTVACSIATSISTSAVTVTGTTTTGFLVLAGF